MSVTAVDAIDIPSFETRLATLGTALAPGLFARINAEVAALIETERSYLPDHKKGGTVAYSVLREKAPTLASHYRSSMTKVPARYFSMKSQATTSTGTMIIISIAASTSPCSSRW